MHTTRRLALAAAALSLLSGGATSLAAQSPTHAYHVDGSLADARGGPSLVGLGGTVGATSYAFAANQGLTLSGAIDDDVYSLELAFTFASTGGWRKIVDFWDRTNDAGLYVYNGMLRFAGGSGTANATPVFTAGTPSHLILTHDANRLFTAYVDGVLTLSFYDNALGGGGGAAMFSGPDNIVSLFVDDANSSEASAGALHWARVYDVALDATQARARFVAGDDALPLTTTTPEPASLALLGGGLAMIGAIAARRRGRAA